MTVQSDLRKAIASAQAAKGTYLMNAESTEDQSAKEKYQEMASDIDRHLEYLTSRLEYLSSTYGQTYQ